jgi:large subunit ribosomal protein L3
MLGLIGKKIGMTQVFAENGDLVPVTVLNVGPCFVVSKKIKDKEGYNALQLGYEDVKEKKVSKPERGLFKKANITPKKVLREFKLEDIEKYNVGQDVKLDIFTKDECVDIIGTSKGNGFAGVMKRWGFSGGPKSHGTTKWHRRAGSIGQSAYPSRVFKGVKMPGRMGGKRSTSKNIRIVHIDKEKNLMLVRGAVPGNKNGFVIIRKKK